jgi:hypothetical protein
MHSSPSFSSNTRLPFSKIIFQKQKKNVVNKNRGTQQDMEAMASPQDGVVSPQGGYVQSNMSATDHGTLMEDPDVWRPT